VNLQLKTENLSPILSSYPSNNSQLAPRILQPETRNLPPVSFNSHLASSILQPVLEISLPRPDRIIFEGKDIELTAREFSLIYLLSQNRGKTITYNDLLETLWTENEYSTYVQITSHLYKIRRIILKTIGNNKKNKKRVRDILKVVSRRGIMLNLAEDKLKIS